MTLSDYYPIMRNDISIYDKDIYDKHSNLIKSSNYLDAVALLKSNDQVNGLTASLLNSWEEKIYNLNKDKPNYFFDPYIYSQIEPINFENKTIWQQEY